ncbi:MAG: DUF4190 domain-containing protein [Bacteroidia bacterium]
MRSLTKFIVLATLSIICFSSCSIEKRNYRSGYHIAWNKNKKETKKPSAETQKSDTLVTEKISSDTPVLSERAPQINMEVEFAATKSLPAGIKVYKSFSLKKQECDNIILRTGEEISAKILEVTIDVIKYRKCENQEGPIYSVLKSEVFMIKYANGTKDIFSAEKENKVGEKSSKPISDGKPKDEAMGIVGMIFGIIAWFMPIIALAVVMLIMAAILGIASLSKIQKNPDKYKGKGFAITAIALGVIGIILIMALGLGSEFN